MALRLTSYRLCFSVLCFLVVITSVNAQFSEADLLKEANALFDKGEYSSAMPLYSQLLSLNPTKPEFNYKYGATALYGDADKKEEAIKYLRYASTKYDIDNKCWYFMGRAYHLNYQFADAIHAYNKFKVLAGNKESKTLHVDREIEDCQNGQNLLSNIKDVKVLDKKQSNVDAFFRLYDLSEIGGRILVTPEELLTSLDKKLNHKSLIHYRGSGTTVYFSSYGKDGKNGLDIYSAEVLPDGKFSNPVLLGPTINTPYDEDFPFLHSDNQSFYFSSKGHSSMGGYDVFQSKLVNGSFTNPVNLDFAVNTPDDDLFYMVDSTKTIANFASARSSKQGELHVYKVLVNSVPADITFVKGSFENEILPNNKLAKITVVDAATNKQIDVQYTDPLSGDYVLSFPRSGRYKFSVEAEKSTRVHSGIVDIPQSSGIKAYLQEMELVTSGGMEKLLINNLFDQHYDGDISALAQNLLKQRASLDVNFNVQDEPEAPATPIVEDQVENIDLAYSAAGFGAGMNNQKLLEASIIRRDDLRAKKQEITDLKQAAKQRYFKALASANTESEQVKDMLAQAETAEDAKKGELMFKAGLAKMEAEHAIREASNTQELISQLSALENNIDKEEQDADTHVSDIESALEANDYDMVVSALKAERTIQQNQDKTKNEYDAVRHIQLESLESRKDAQKYLDRASSMRSQSNEVQNKLMNKQTLRARSKGKEAKALDVEIQQLTADAEEINERVETAYKQATGVQEQSYNKDQQFDIISDLEQEIRHPDFKSDESVSDVAAQTPSLSDLSTQVAELEVNSNLVSQYLKDNPDANNHFTSEKTAKEFRKTYGAGDYQSSQGETSDLAFDGDSETIGNDLNHTSAANPDKPQDEESSIKDDAANETTDEIALVGDSSETGNEEAAENQISENIGSNIKDVDAQENNVLEDTAFAETENEITKSDKIPTDREIDSENEDLSELENDNAQPQEELFGFENDSIDSPFAEAETNHENQDTESTNEDGLELAEAEKGKKKSDEEEVIEIAEDQLADINEGEVITENPEISAPQKEKIAIEEGNIAAAEDWIAIIDASIADLEDGVGDTEGESIEDQLKQYRALKQTKEKEIVASETKIKEWNTGSTSASAKLALARTESDLDTLSVSHIARLEMRISDIAHEKKYQDNINTVDPNYLDDLSKVELSGKSDPEIATGRLALNTGFIEALDAHLVKADLGDMSNSYLLELRRIKGLEVRQDRLIQTGAFAYAPRSKEAIDYANVLASVPDEKTNESSSKDDLEFEGLSPELAADLKVPYSREGMVDNYNSQKENIESLYRDEDLLIERIALNNKLYKSLQKEIGFYQGAVQTVSGSESGEVILKRYSTLLAERNAVVGEIEADQTALRSYDDIAVKQTVEKSEIEEAEIEESQTEEPLEVFIDSEPEAVEDVTATEIDKDRATHNYVSDFEQEYRDEVQAIESMQYNEHTRLEETATLNVAMANKMDSIVNVLVNELDKPGTPENKDNLQMQIQNLDAVAADKRQEADRMLAESQLAAIEPIDNDLEQGFETDSALFMTTETPLAEAETNTTDVALQPIDVAAMEGEWEEEINISNLKYKSLNANIAVNSINPLVASLAKEKSEARELAAQINTISEPSERARAMAELEAVNTEITELQVEIQTEVSSSNAAEIAYFQSSNEQLFKDLNTLDTPAEIEIDKTAYVARQTELRQELSTIESRYSKKEITINERIEAEMEVIGELSEMNETLQAEVSRLDLKLDPVESVGIQPIKSGRHGDDEVLRSMMSVPENYAPEPGKMYITPVHSYVNASMSNDHKAELARNDSDVAVDFDFVLNPSAEADENLLRLETNIDEKGLVLLSENKNQHMYALASLKADSLKRLEKHQAEFAKRMDNESMEKFAEVNRLTGMIETETHPKLKKDLESRVDRIVSEATVNYQKSTMASFQAEKLRNLRKEQELEIASLTSKLNQKELAEINELLGGEPYTVVPSDFASAELSKEESKGKDEPKKVVENQKDTSDLTEETFIEETEVTPEIAEVEPKPEEPLSSDVITVNENLHSIDEQLLLEAHGNWLNVFEVIADKDDFSDVKESLFVKSEGSVYSDDTRIPINPPMPSGLVFQVQVGAFRNNIPQDLFGDFAPVMGQELPNGITRYRAGIFKVYKGAIVARNEIRKRGYSDAFVVAYIDGERLTGTQAQHILEQARVDEGMTVAETRIIPDPVTQTSEPAVTASAVNQGAEASGRTDYYNDPEAADANLVEATSGLFFTVQVGVYSKPVKLDALYHLVELNSELTTTGYIRYTSGRYTSTETAEVRKAAVIEKGVTDAFITAYYNGKRISAARAQNILDEQGTSVLSPAIESNDTIGEPAIPDAPKDVVKYVVILGSYAGDVPQNIANVFLERSDLQIRRVTAPNGVSIYASPEFDTKEAADEFLQLSLDAGVDSAVMGKVVNGKISAVGSK